MHCILRFLLLSLVNLGGDSYSRTGFDPSGTQPSTTNPLGNPSYPGRTSSNGPNWVGYLTTKYNDSSILTYNFAGSGATLDKSIVDNNGYDVIREIDEGYLRYYGNDTIESSTSIFVVWIGINDITNSYLDGNDTTHSSIFKSFRYRIDSLYETGARNFLLLSVPPLERAPRTTQSSDAENRVPLMKDAVQDWNQRLEVFKRRIQYLHSNANVFLFDTYSLFQKVIDDPAQYEETAIYKDTTTYCSAYQRRNVAFYIFNMTLQVNPLKISGVDVDNLYLDFKLALFYVSRNET
ncbi:unnamed protein product [Clonostachys rosea]|uniref:SGNH hydrolase-type esterase domain-containing protein n=1 Tax=Bionectria ochroleuca TaxID=29856 RepID=A0ABY6TTB3_BIOOC|nr:unnamed protein product [Clonostachys rosea]